MKKSSRSGKIIKSHEVDDDRIGGFCLLTIDGEVVKPSVEEEQEEETEQEKQSDQTEASKQAVSEQDLERIYQEARERGYREGYEKGFKQGRTEGLKKGYSEGFAKGKEEGFKAGKSEGIEAGKEEGFELGKREGYSKGFEEGKAEARRIIEDRYRKILQEAQRSLNELSDLKKRFEDVLASSEDLLLEVVITAMQKLFFYIPPEKIVRETVRELIEKLSDNHKATLFINPRDAKFIEDLEIPPWLEVKEDGTLKRGACVIETEAGSIETSLCARLKEFQEMVLKRVNGE